jgi:transmembrane sensor
MDKLINHYSNRMEFYDQDIEKKILDRASRLRVPGNISANDALIKFRSRLSDGETNILKNNIVRINFAYTALSIAAGLLIFVGLWYIFIRPDENEFIAEKGFHKEYLLPDNSRVSLNADSKITWSGKHFHNERYINLEGEAFFDVSQGNPFTISVDRGKIKVLGTSFNVFSRDVTLKVTCFTGQVQVTSGEETVILSSGESAELIDNELKNYRDVNSDKIRGWLNGEFFYQNSPIRNVFDEIERQFNVKFVRQNFQPGFFTGSFTNKDLRAALDIVCIPMDLNYEIGSNGKIFITEISK